MSDCWGLSVVTNWAKAVMDLNEFMIKKVGLWMLDPKRT